MTARLRDAQNAVMLFQFLSNSISDEAKAELTVQPQLYTIQDVQDGLCFLKLIISKAQVDTIATVNVLRNALGRLENKMVEYSGNLTEFNMYTRAIINNLAAYGETTPDSDLMNNLFRAYHAVEDEQFQSYLMFKRTTYEEGAEMTPHQMMEYAENQYKIRTEAGTWKAPTKKDDEITALRTQIESLKKQGSNRRTDKSGEGKEGSASHAWKKIPPGEGKPKTKEYQGRKYHWCLNHKAWTMHSNEECRGVAPKRDKKKPTEAFDAEETEDNAPTKEEEKKAPTVKVNTVLSSIFEDGARFFH
jgi:capsule polysaccharide export protein KpsE/RkpR